MAVKNLAVQQIQMEKAMVYITIVDKDIDKRNFSHQSVWAGKDESGWIRKKEKTGSRVSKKVISLGCLVMNRWLVSNERN